MDPENVPTFLGGECECEGGCNYADKGPWQGFKGDRVTTPHWAEMQEIAKYEKDPENYVEPSHHSGGEEEEHKDIPDEDEEQKVGEHEKEIAGIQTNA